MEYVSTRGKAPSLDLSNVILKGLAEDGGLYMPQKWPVFSKKEIRALQGLSYQEIAFFVLEAFIDGEIASEKLQMIIQESYRNFRHKTITPLLQIGANSFVLELFHGPTLAFKDIAMQLLSRIMNYILEDINQYITVVGATSGDTGAAAVEAFAENKRVEVFILFPKDKISLVQQRQMTTSKARNVHVIAIDGNFDDCQRLVKEMFSDISFREAVNLSGINSINWARILAQMVYYFAAAVALGAPDRNVSFSVPTGNFGDIFAGYSAKRMGLTIENLILATNNNDILVRTLETGLYKTTQVKPTISPSMDIQVSSNFERLLFEASNRDVLLVNNAMISLQKNGFFKLSSDLLDNIKRDFYAKSASEDDTNEAIRSTLEYSGYLIDPHTATAIYAASEYQNSSVPLVTLATAHPSKFPAAVEAAAGIKPRLPVWLEDLMERKENFEILNNDIIAIKELIYSYKLKERLL
ncbi:Threonine synthase [Liberibacter crescens BT-1]|uniref:Threonine synthase n=1 Tax=Liberibacter crescens (strain BT-1) TaxID=1215343 RepID=L0ET27_LIBCB|nr:threonine synthase [Liberibacter crescens]AGA64092.1 Threonine synthase [Liberibacter crescens BT-1]AMC12377.1 threonine synthase [Liberibacter crescens]